MVETEVVAGFYQDYNLIGVMELGENFHCETLKDQLKFVQFYTRFYPTKNH